MKYPLFFLLTNALIAQDAAKSPATNAPIISMDTHGKSMIVIDSKARANDYVQAFDFLRKDKPTFRIMIRTNDTVYTGVTDVSVAAGGTLLMIKVPSNQGIRTQIVPVEQIMEINYSL